MCTSATIGKLADELEALLAANPMVGAKPEVIKQLEFLTARLTAYDQVGGDKASAIVQKAKILYSARKHWDYPGGTDALRAEMQGLLGQIRQAARHRERLGD